MAGFGKRPDGGSGQDEADYVRIPAGTRIAAGAEGKLVLAFAGDMSFGESLPELAEIQCGRNLSIDAGVTLRADAVRVKAELELMAGARVVARELEADRIVSRRGTIEARTIASGTVECEASKVVAERLTARETVSFDRGEVEVGTIVAQTLAVAKGTTANVLIAEVAKLDGAVTKGGYESFNEFLAKVLLYHPEVLNDRFTAEARRGGGPEARSAALAEADEPALDPAGLARLAQEGQRLKAAYADKEIPREIAELVGLIEAGRVADVRRSLTPIYNRLAPLGKMPDPVMQSFGVIQKLFRDGERRREARPA